jgi:hypothetical protein
MASDPPELLGFLEPQASTASGHIRDTPPDELRSHQQKSADFQGFPRADARIRTGDPFITSEVLYQLSYVGGKGIVAALARWVSGGCG